MAKNMPSMASHQALRELHHHRRNSNPLKSCGSSMKPLPNFNVDFSSVICEPMLSRSATKGLDVLKVEVKGTVKTSTCLHPDLRIPKRRKLDLDVGTIHEDAPATCNEKSSSNGLLQSSLNDDVRTVIEPQASERLLRAALLKSRFADTILKAKEKMMHLANQKNVSDPVTSCQERLKLEMIMKEEKIKLQAEVEAAQEIVKRAHAEAISNARRESHFMLEQMEKSLENNGNEDFLEDLEMHLIYTREGFSFNSRSPLKQLGLFMKRDEDEEMTIDRPIVTDNQQGPDIMAMESEDAEKHARVAALKKRSIDNVLKTREMIMPLSTIFVVSDLYISINITTSKS